jgi:hypothetical protein
MSKRQNITKYHSTDHWLHTTSEMAAQCVEFDMSNDISMSKEFTEFRASTSLRRVRQHMLPHSLLFFFPVIRPCLAMRDLFFVFFVLSSSLEHFDSSPACLHISYLYHILRVLLISPTFLYLYMFFIPSVPLRSPPFPFPHRLSSSLLVHRRL